MYFSSLENLVDLKSGFEGTNLKVWENLLNATFQMVHSHRMGRLSPSTHNNHRDNLDKIPKKYPNLSEMYILLKGGPLLKHVAKPHFSLPEEKVSYLLHLGVQYVEIHVAMHQFF